jgi:hypothetical protein
MRGITARSAQPKDESRAPVNRVLEGFLAERKPVSFLRESNALGYLCRDALVAFGSFCSRQEVPFNQTYHRGSKPCSKGPADAATEEDPLGCRHRCGPAPRRAYPLTAVEVASKAGAQDLFGCSSSSRFTRSTAGGITSPMPVHTRSVTASS